MKRFLTPLALATTCVMTALVVTVSTANQSVKNDVEQAVRYNFSAAGLLAKLQVQAERMRRYEKEMFIYAAVPDKRAKYAKDFDDAYTKLLDLQNQALASQHRGFSDADREAVKKWAAASSFYANEFRKVSTSAETAAPETKNELTLKLNNEIGPGKDRFREVLDGAAAMREAKEKASMEIGTAIGNSFQQLDWILAGLAAAISASSFFVFARKTKAASMSANSEMAERRA
jgi:hypothetical protein